MDAAWGAPVAELVDAADSKSVVRKDVGVRVSLGAPLIPKAFKPLPVERSPAKTKSGMSAIEMGETRNLRSSLPMLPQQRLLLELLSMSGDIAVPTNVKDTILWRTLDECVQARLVSLDEINDNISRVSITALGRASIKQSQRFF